MTYSASSQAEGQTPDIPDHAGDGRPRAKTRVVRVGTRFIGGDWPVAVQSMTKTDTRNVSATVEQIRALEHAGCEIVRVAVPDEEAARALGKIRAAIGIPLVADIHFDHRLALLALEQGVDKLRINPGNIGSRTNVKEVVAAARDRGVPIRIGVNEGSLEKEILAKYGAPTPQAMVQSALGHVQILEELGYEDIVISLKAFSVPRMVEAYRLMSRLRPYPLHLGVTEAGGGGPGLIRSAIGIGLLLMEGIGDTVRVSLTGPPEEEVVAAYEILRATERRQRGPTIISCPSCGRTQINLVAVASEVRARLAGVSAPVTVAVMGCAVNGPGEARDADFAIAGGKRSGLIYRRGKIVKKVPEDRLVDELVALVISSLEENDTRSFNFSEGGEHG